MTSALDADTEKAIVSTLFDAMKGRSVLVIAHRMSTIRKADEVSNFPPRRVSHSVCFKFDQTQPSSCVSSSLDLVLGKWQDNRKGHTRRIVAIE